MEGEQHGKRTGITDRDRRDAGSTPERGLQETGRGRPPQPLPGKDRAGEGVLRSLPERADLRPHSQIT